MVYTPFILGVVHSIDLNKLTITCIYYYGILHSISPALKILCVIPIYPSPPIPQPLAITGI